MKKSVFLLLAIGLLVTSCSKDQQDEQINTTDWMNLLISSYPNKTITLTDITVPAAHDAGTYVLPVCRLGNICNTQTQHLDIQHQLEAGIRIFDIRPVLFNAEYYTQHFTECGGYGCKGDLIQNILSQTRAFLDAHSELVILKLSHFCATGADDSVFVNMIDGTLGDRIYKETEVNPLPFIRRPLNDILPTGQPGKAVIIYDETLADNPANRAKGMFTGAILPGEGSYSNIHIFESMRQDQLNKFTNFSNNATTLFEFSWTLTQSSSLAVDCVLKPDSATSIHDLANIADSALAPTLSQWIDNGTIAKGNIPNIISVDFADRFVTEQCVRLSKLNLE